MAAGLTEWYYCGRVGGMYYHYRQNNSRGYFRKPAVNVYIEAETLEEANKTFLTIDGCYFDPNCHFDCSCCGSRWDSAHWETLTISQVRESIKQAQGSTTLWMNEDIPTAYIQHKNEPCEIIG